MSTGHNTNNNDWREMFQAAVLETNREKLQQRVEAAEAAIFSRLQELNSEHGRQAERHELDDAIRMLRVIKEEKLHYPHWKGGIPG
jgi:hypothetical protein